MQQEASVPGLDKDLGLQNVKICWGTGCPGREVTIAFILHGKHNGGVHDTGWESLEDSPQMFCLA